MAGPTACRWDRDFGSDLKRASAVLEEGIGRRRIETFNPGKHTRSVARLHSLSKGASSPAANVNLYLRTAFTATFDCLAQRPLALSIVPVFTVALYTCASRRHLTSFFIFARPPQDRYKL